MVKKIIDNNEIQEIVRTFKEAKNPGRQIGILADLHCTSKSVIEHILREALGDEYMDKYTSQKAEGVKAARKHTNSNLDVVKSTVESKMNGGCVSVTEEPASEVKGKVDEKAEDKADEKPIEEGVERCVTFRSLDKNKRDAAYRAVVEGINYNGFLVITCLPDNNTSRICYRNLKSKAKREGLVQTTPQESRESVGTESGTTGIGDVNNDSTKLFDSLQGKQQCSEVSGMYGTVIGKLDKLSETNLTVIKDKLVYLTDVESMINNLVNVKLRLLSELNELL